MADPRDSGEPKKPRRQAKTPEERENQLIAATLDLAEKQIHAGTASSQTMNIFLKRSTTRDELEMRKIDLEIKLLEAKTIQIETADNGNSLAEAAINALRGYQGLEAEEYEDDEYDY